MGCGEPFGGLDGTLAVLLGDEHILDELSARRGEVLEHGDEEVGVHEVEHQDGLLLGRWGGQQQVDAGEVLAHELIARDFVVGLVVAAQGSPSEDEAMGEAVGDEGAEGRLGRALACGRGTLLN